MFARLCRDPAGCLVKPGGKRVGLANGFSESSEAEENGLENVLGIVRVIDHSTGGSEHHRTVACDQQFKGFAIVGRDEPLQQQCVVRWRGLIAQPTKVLLQSFWRSNGHARVPVERMRSSLIS